MVGILLTILKVILILIGAIFAIALAILAVVLFNFCRYEAKGSKSDNIWAEASFKWLFGIVKGRYEIYDDGVKYSLYVPFGLCNISYSSAEDNVDIYTEEENILNSDENFNKTVANFEKNGNINSIMKGFINLVISIIKGVIGFIKTIFTKFSDIEFINDKYGIKSIISATFKLVIKIFKNLGLKVCTIEGILGLEDPCDTGKAIGACSVVREFVPFDINIEGNFENKEITGEFNIKGRTNLWLVLFPVAKYIFTRPVWPLVRDYWKGEFDG